jgi:hypothetical protein
VVFAVADSLSIGGAMKERAWIRIDERCSLPYRVYVSRQDYDQTTQWEEARFLSWKRAREFVKDGGYNWLRTGDGE